MLYALRLPFTMSRDISVIFIVFETNHASYVRQVGLLGFRIEYLVWGYRLRFWFNITVSHLSALISHADVILL